MKIFVNEPIHPAAMELLRSRAEVVSEWESRLSARHWCGQQKLDLIF